MDVVSTLLSVFFPQHNYFEIHPCGYVFILFIGMSSIPLCDADILIYHTLFVHSPVDEHLRCFQFGALTNKAAMNICV